MTRARGDVLDAERCVPDLDELLERPSGDGFPRTRGRFLTAGFDFAPTARSKVTRARPDRSLMLR
jgi:hypothetical protein